MNCVYMLHKQINLLFVFIHLKDDNSEIQLLKMTCLVSKFLTLHFIKYITLANLFVVWPFSFKQFNSEIQFIKFPITPSILIYCDIIPCDISSLWYYSLRYYSWRGYAGDILLVIFLPYTYELHSCKLTYKQHCV